MKIQSIFYKFQNKAVALFILILILSLLCVYYYDNYEVNAEYPSVKTIISNYPEGKTVSVNGVVSGIYNGGFYLKDNFHGEKVVYKINSSSKVEINDYVSVLGRLGPAYSIEPSKILIAKRWKEDFLLLRSAIGGIILFLIFWRYWKLDFKLKEFIRRK